MCVGSISDQLLDLDFAAPAAATTPTADVTAEGGVDTAAIIDSGVDLLGGAADDDDTTQGAAAAEATFNPFETITDGNSAVLYVLFCQILCALHAIGGAKTS